MQYISLGYTNPFRSRFSEEFFKTLPAQPGVYFFLDAGGEPLYIGKADHLRKRLLQYASAKPGQVKEHTLEMLELASEVKWELFETGAEALAREGDLLRAVKPPFNVAGTHAVPYLFFGTKVSNETDKLGYKPTEFRLSYSKLGTDFKSYGCFHRRGKAKAAYSALLRLLFASTCSRERFLIPAKINRSSPAYVYRGLIHPAWEKPLDLFLNGEANTLLALLMKRLLSQENIQPHLYAPLQRDLTLLREFFVVGPQALREIRTKLGMKGTTISQKKLDAYLQTAIRDELVVVPELG